VIETGWIMRSVHEEKQGTAEPTSTALIPIEEASEEHLDFYQRLRRQIRDWQEQKGTAQHGWVDVILLAPDFFHLLCRLLLDPAVPIMSKAKIAAVITYFVAPLDVLPELFLGPVGYVDDVVLAAFLLESLAELLHPAAPEILQRHWAGREEVLHVVRRVIEQAHSFLNAHVLHALRAYLNRKSSR